MVAGILACDSCVAVCSCRRLCVPGAHVYVAHGC